MSHIEKPPGPQVVDLLACHALASALARDGLPARRDARRALVRLFSQSGVPVNPVMPKSANGLEDGFIANEETVGNCLAGLVLAAFRPEWVTDIRTGLCHYFRHPEQWKEDILKPFNEWINE